MSSLFKKQTDHRLPEIESQSVSEPELERRARKIQYRRRRSILCGRPPSFKHLARWTRRLVWRISICGLKTYYLQCSVFGELYTAVASC
eukprot:5766650-Pleurochrysis_carterae.AAC.4